MLTDDERTVAEDAAIAAGHTIVEGGNLTNHPCHAPDCEACADESITGHPLPDKYPTQAPRWELEDAHARGEHADERLTDCYGCRMAATVGL